MMIIIIYYLYVYIYLTTNEDNINWLAVCVYTHIYNKQKPHKRSRPSIIYNDMDNIFHTQYNIKYNVWCVFKGYVETSICILDRVTMCVYI